MVNTAQVGNALIQLRAKSDRLRKESYDNDNNLNLLRRYEELAGINIDSFDSIKLELTKGVTNVYRLNTGNVNFYPKSFENEVNEAMKPHIVKAIEALKEVLAKSITHLV